MVRDKKAPSDTGQGGGESVPKDISGFDSQAGRALFWALVSELRQTAVFQIGLDPTAPKSFRVRYTSPNFQDLTGVGDPADIRNWYAACHPDDLGLVEEQRFKIIDSGQRAVFRVRLIHPRRGLRHFEIRTTPPLTDDQGRTGLGGLVLDRTELFEARQTARDSEDSLIALIENLSNPAAVFEGGQLILVNRAWLAITGFTSTEAVKMRFWDIIHPEDMDQVREAGLRWQAGDLEPGHREFRILTGGGETRWWSGTVTPIRYKGRPAGLGMAWDVTERKALEESLRENRRSLKAILDATSDATILLDREGTILTANQTVAARLRLPLSEIVGRKIYEVMKHQSLANRQERFFRVLETGRPIRFEDERGGLIIDNTLYPIREEDGQVGQVAVISRDVTYQRRLEQILRDKEDQASSRTPGDAPEEVRGRSTGFAPDRTGRLIRERVLPILKELLEADFSDSQRSRLAALEQELNQLISPLEKLRATLGVDLTPAQEKVLDLIREGHTTPEIARLTGVSRATVSYHRSALRRKLGLTGSAVSLRDFLSSLETDPGRL